MLLFFHTTLHALGVSDENCYHDTEYDNIEEEDSKDGSQEGSKEHLGITNKATAERERNGASIRSVNTLNPLHLIVPIIMMHPWY